MEEIELLLRFVVIVAIGSSIMAVLKWLMTDREEPMAETISCHWCEKANGPDAIWCVSCGHQLYFDKRHCHCRECNQRGDEREVELE